MFKMIDLACVVARTIEERLGMMRHRKNKKRDISNGEKQINQRIRC